MDETLRLWGRNIASIRKSLRPDGLPKANVNDGMPHMSQAQLGALLDPPVEQVTVSRWERGLREPRRYHKAQLARIGRTDVERLFPMTRAVA